MKPTTPHKIRRSRRGTPAFGDTTVPKDPNLMSGRKSSLQEKPNQRSPLKYQDRLQDVKKYGSLKQADKVPIGQREKDQDESRPRKSAPIDLTSEQMNQVMAKTNGTLDYQQLVNGWGQTNNEDINMSKQPLQNAGDQRIMSPMGFDVNLSKIGGIPQESLDLSDITSNRSDAGVNIDQICDLIRMNCVSFGFPDCGHLRSNQMKDIKNRMKCIQAMLQQHKLDLDFRKLMKEEGKTNESELRNKLDRFKNTISQLDNENQALVEQLREKQKYIDQHKNEHEKFTQDKYNIMVQQAQIKQTGKIIDNPKDLESPEKQMMRMAEKQNAQVMDKIRQENRMMKEIIIKTQEWISKTVNTPIETMQLLEKIQKRGDLTESLKQMAEKCELQDFDEFKILMPQSHQNIKLIIDIMKSNIAKMNKFTNTIVNPGSLAQLIIELNAVKIKDVEVVETEDSKMMNFKNAKKSTASAGDILNLPSSMNQTLDQFQKKSFNKRRLRGERFSIRSQSRGPALGTQRDSVASNTSMVTRKIIKPIGSTNVDEPSYVSKYKVDDSVMNIPMTPIQYITTVSPKKSPQKPSLKSPKKSPQKSPKAKVKASPEIIVYSPPRRVSEDHWPQKLAPSLQQSLNQSKRYISPSQPIVKDRSIDQSMQSKLQITSFNRSMDHFSHIKKTIEDPTSHRQASKTPERRSIQITKPRFGQFQNSQMISFNAKAKKFSETIQPKAPGRMSLPLNKVVGVMDPRNSARPSFHARDPFDREQPPINSDIVYGQKPPLNTVRVQPLDVLDRDKYIPLYKRNQNFQSNNDPFDRVNAEMMLPAHQEDMIEQLEASERARKVETLSKAKQITNLGFQNVFKGSIREESLQSVHNPQSERGFFSPQSSSGIDGIKKRPKSKVQFVVPESDDEGYQDVN